MRRLILFSCLAALLGPAGPAAADETVIWLGIGTGLTWYNEIDPDDLEELATAGSIRSVDPTSTRRINFDDKGFEVPVLVQMGLRLTPNVNLWGMYQRLPYILDGPIPGLESGGTPSDPPDDSIRLRVPANVFGGGMDFRLGRDGAMKSLILSVGLGALSFEGKDEDVLQITNFTMSGRGILYEAQLMFEVDFARDLKFYPFVAFRYAEITDTDAEYVRSAVLNPSLPEYAMSYTGITVGISARFKVWPFDPVDDEPSIFDP
jgi:hypothetical protein